MRKVKVNITKYVSTEAGLRYCPAVITSNGRIKQNIVLVGGKEERHPEGAYYLDWRENGVRTRLSVGKNAQDALTQRDRKAFAQNAASHGVVVQKDQNTNPTDFAFVTSASEAITSLPFLRRFFTPEMHRTLSGGRRRGSGRAPVDRGCGPSLRIQT